MGEQNQKQTYFTLIFNEIEPKQPNEQQMSLQEIAKLNNKYQEDKMLYEQKLYDFYKSQKKEFVKSVYNHLTNINQFDFSQIELNNAFWLSSNINESNQDYTILFKHMGCYKKKRENKIKDIRYQDSVFVNRDFDFGLRIVKFSKVHDSQQTTLFHFIPLQNNLIQLRKNKQNKKDGFIYDFIDQDQSNQQSLHQTSFFQNRYELEENVLDDTENETQYIKQNQISNKQQNNIYIQTNYNSNNNIGNKPNLIKNEEPETIEIYSDDEDETKDTEKNQISDQQNDNIQPQINNTSNNNFQNKKNLITKQDLDNDKIQIEQLLKKELSIKKEIQERLEIFQNKIQQYKLQQFN
ncbi:hypothetical protein ABPG74_014380 [Tetrahymena malaccensis]